MMPRRSRNSLYGEQLSQHFLSEPKALDAPSFYRHMFLEDIAVGFMPLGGQFKPARLRVTLEPADLARAEMIGETLNRGQSRSLADGVCEFLRRVGSRVCEEDSTSFEIVYLQATADGPPVAFDLVALEKAQLLLKQGGCYQIIPPEVARERHIAERIYLPEENVMEFTLPKQWRSAVRDSRETLTNLATPGFFGLSVDAQKAGVPYDFRDHQRHLNLALAEVGSSLGWTARGAFNGEVLSYTWIRMQLKFERFKIQLRKSLLDELNAGLSKVGAVMGFSAAIRVEGLPTESVVDTAQQNLLDGQMPFTEVMKDF